MRQHTTEDDITAGALASYEAAPDARLRQITASLIKHLHAFVREVGLTEAEWFKAIDFLTRTGQICDDRRQEFILLSDVLGVSMLVDLINHRVPEGATESTVLGPFFAHGAPELPYGGNIAPTDKAAPAFLSGRILDDAGRPVAGATIDAWQTGSDGLYDTQRPDAAVDMRGRFRSEADGRFRVRTVRPVSYSIPLDGPVGELMHASQRQPRRPAHIHLLVAAPGYETLVTHFFDAADPHLDRDPVFAVKDSLICEFQRHDAASAEFAAPPPFYTIERDIVLKAASGAATGGPSWGARKAAE
jgi:protocatechuate 3,4-dioxygenase beta subunit